MNLIKTYKLNRKNLNPTVKLYRIAEDGEGNNFLVEYEPQFGASAIEHDRFETVEEAIHFISELEEKTDDEEAE